MIPQTMRLNVIWGQKKIPVVLRRTGKGERLRVRIPYDESNRLWLRNNRPFRPIWDKEQEYWEIPKAWFDDFVERALRKFGKLYIIQPYREQEICAPACWNATGHECQCQCMGANHGQGDDNGWFIVSDAFATRWQDRDLACRLLALK